MPPREGGLENSGVASALAFPLANLMLGRSAAVFGTKKVTMFEMNKHLARHLA